MRRALTIALTMLVGACATPMTRPLPGHPGWVLVESTTPPHGMPDDYTAPGACDRPWETAQHGPPLPPCGWSDAVTICSEHKVVLWWYARPGALEHELVHVDECTHYSTH